MAAPLPNWDLSDLFPAPDAPELKAAIEDAARRSEAFVERYQGRVAALSAAELFDAIAAYEAIDEAVSRIGAYAGLLHATDMTDGNVQRFYADIRETITSLASRLMFFGLEINRLEDAELEKRLEDSKLKHYAPWIRDQRVFRPYQLSDDLERLLVEKSLTGSQSWVRLFDETVAALKIALNGSELGLEAALNLLSEPDRETRKMAAQGLARSFKTHVKDFALILNTLIKDKEIEDRWRGYKDPADSRHLANQVEPEVVDALVKAVDSRLDRLSHRYYRLKARWLDLDHLEYWDRNAPLPNQPERRFDWNEAQSLVLEAYRSFSEALAEQARPFFERAWIDAAMRPGKSPGAFAHPTVPSAHPYLLLNYQGRVRDVMTLAHELGHGVHQRLAYRQGHLMAATPLTLAETASVFGEMLTFRALLDGAPDKKTRQAMLASKVEDMINTVVRQTAFYQFERRLHAARKEGELSPERIGEIWLEIQGRSLGPAFRFAPGYETYWCYISHFIHSPFYVYAYAFGDCLVNSLYAVYQQSSAGFAERYLEMLAAGGTKRHKELLAPFGLDASDPAFWARGLGVIEGFIDELENAG